MTHKHKHVPQRMCAVCRQAFEKRALTGIVRTAEGVFVDLSGKRNGRGAYLCDNPACRERAIQTNVLNNALRTTLTVDDRERLREVAP
ncbi:MAG: YlxR family protein [Chloroflexota bacterium]